MKYDFTTIMDRKGQDATAIDTIGTSFKEAPLPPREGFDVIPMWCADMNFPTVPTVTEAITERVKQPHFGYFMPREEYFDSIIKWHETRYGVKGLTKECIGYENGVHGGNCNALSVLCARGDSVLLNVPIYASFIKNLKNDGYNAVLSELVQDEQGVWRMDYKDMEKKIIENNVHTAVFCSPHNPMGRVWERWELEKMMDLYKQYDVYVISDEIWADITLDGHKHIPLQSVSEDARMRTIATYAPSKTFNLAGLVGSYHIIYNKRLRERIDKAAALTHYNKMNVLSMYALIGAYKPEGYEWADELCETLSGNADYAYRYITEHFDGVSSTKPEGTYMLFLDCTQWCKKNHKTIDDVIKAGWDVGVAWQDGRPFQGKCHIRMNLASPLSRIQEAMERLDKYVFNVR